MRGIEAGIPGVPAACPKHWVSAFAAMSGMDVGPIRAGLLCRCPNCGKGRLFAGFLRVVERCAVCGFDFTRLNTGDGAAVFVMQIAGGLVVFTALFVEIAYAPPMWVHLLVFVPLVLGLSLGLMRPGKGVMIALQMRK